MNLLEYLEKNCMSHAKFAKKIGLSVSTINNILRGVVDLKLTVAMKIEIGSGGKVTCRDLYEGLIKKES